MTVYAVHEVRDDISPALKFGELRYINRFYIHGDELERHGDDNLIPNGYLANMNRAVVTFDPDVDFLLIAGDHLQLLALTAILSAKFPSFMVLRYDRQLNDYIPVRLYSGLVPPPGPVLGLGTNIGDDHGESRNQEAQRLYRENERILAGIDHPVCEYCEKRHDARVACPEYAAHRRTPTGPKRTS